jgi:hypothetical protein
MSPSQIPALHTVPTGYFSQVPLPSHAPSRPQVDVESALHSASPDRGRTPAGTGEHMPSALGSPHVTQVPVQAELQQYPSTQLPLWH